MIREAQSKLLECLHFMWEHPETEYSSEDLQFKNRLLMTCRTIIANFEAETTKKCPDCGSDNLFKVELIHIKCRKCKSRYTN